MAEGQYPDVEGGLRDYLRADAGVSALVAQRVFFGIPDTPSAFPLITVQRVGGADDISDAYIDQALVQIDCWGRLYADSNPEAKGGDRAQCDQVRRAVRARLSSIRGATVLNSETVAYNAAVQSDPYSPDPANGRPRYVITVQVTARTGSLTSA